MADPRLLIPAETARILALRDQGVSYRQIAKTLGRSTGAVYKTLWHAGALGDKAVGPRPRVTSKAAKPVATENKFEEREDGTATASAVVDSPVRTLEDAVDAAGVDLTVWFVDRWEATAWTMGGRQEYRVALKLRRIMPRALADAVQNVISCLKKAAPKWPKLPTTPPGKGEEYMAAVMLYDVHFGKLSWRLETGADYDLKIAENLFRNAVIDIVNEHRHRRIAKFLLPIGNDFFHVDTRTLTTTAGTPQDFDGRFSKMLQVGKLSAIWAVEQLAAIAPVQVCLVSGNHDRTLSEVLCHILDARFHNTPRVTVDKDPKSRKYVRFGKTLIGLTHGDLVKPTELPNLMAVDVPHDWAATTTREILTGHGHRTMKWTSKDTDDYRGVVVRQMRALTRTDLWHFDKGYCGQSPAAEVYLYGKERGYVGHSVVPARGD